MLVANVSRMVPMCVVLMAVISLPSHGGGSEPVGRSAKVELGRREDTRVVARTWNLAVEAAQDHRWSQVLDTLEPSERTYWKDHSGGLELLSLAFLAKTSANGSECVVYQDQNGAGLSHVFQERREFLKVGQAQVQVFDRRRLATFTRRAGHPWLISGSDRDDHAFGLGESVGGICLTVSPAEQTIASWQDLRFSVSLENVRDSVVIQTLPQPSFYLHRNLTIGLLGSVPQESASAFRQWYATAESMSVPPISGLLESMQKRHSVRSLDPGEQQKYELSLRNLCWIGGAIPMGPTGTFDLFVVYNAALESDPVQAALPTWQHRVASAKFRVIVQPATDR